MFSKLFKYIVTSFFPFVVVGVFLSVIARDSGNPFGQWLAFIGNNYDGSSSIFEIAEYNSLFIDSLNFIYIYILPPVFFITGILTGLLVRDNVVFASIASSMPAVVALGSLRFSSTFFFFSLSYLLLSILGGFIAIGFFQKGRNPRATSPKS